MFICPTRDCGSGRARRAFTLIELLVVVAIIALLISILLPGLRAAREQAKQLICVTNLQSMGRAAGEYATANRDFVVRGEEDHMHFAASLFAGLGYPDIRIVDLNEDGVVAGDSDVIWHSSRAARYQRELLNVKQFRCPSDPHPEQVLSYVVNGFSFPYFKQPGDNEDVEPGDDTGPANAQAPEVVFSRVSDLSVTVTIDVRNPDIPRIAKRTAVSPFETQPASKIYLTEANKKTPLPGDRNWGVFHDIFVFRHLPFASVDARISNDRRHPGGVTAMFFDGHADVLKFNEIDSGFPRRFDDRLRMFTAFRQDD